MGLLIPILLSCALLMWLLGGNLVQIVAMVLFSVAVFMTGKRVRE